MAEETKVETVTIAEAAAREEKAVAAALKTLGVKSLDEAKAALKAAADAKASQQTELEKVIAANRELAAKIAEQDTAHAGLQRTVKTRDLRDAGREAGAKLHLDASRSDQILKLIDVDPEKFDAKELDTKFGEFVAANKHFSVAPPAVGGGNRQPPAPSAGVADLDPKMAALRKQITSIGSNFQGS